MLLDLIEDDLNATLNRAEGHSSMCARTPCNCGLEAPSRALTIWWCAGCRRLRSGAACVRCDGRT